jgi:hypothetical protein
MQYNLHNNYNIVLLSFTIIIKKITNNNIENDGFIDDE